MSEEVGRWREGGVRCRVCGGEFEDAWHVLVECKGYADVRKEFWREKVGRELEGEELEKKVFSDRRDDRE